MKKNLLTISEAAKRLNVDAETLRRWDKLGKFKSSRHPINNYRVYDEEQVALLVQDIQLNLYQEPAAQHSENRGKPFFNTSLGNLYQGDSLKLLKKLEPASVDLIFADPPLQYQKGRMGHILISGGVCRMEPPMDSRGCKDSKKLRLSIHLWVF